MKELKDILLRNLESLPVPVSGGLPEAPARVLYGRGGAVPGFEDINIDIYPPLVFITLYGARTDAEIESLGLSVSEVFIGSPVLIQDRSSRPAEIRWERGEIPSEIVVSENGVSFIVSPRRGQNQGFFPDMRGGRAAVSSAVRQLCAAGADGACVLNLFAYTCAFSVVSLISGASKVVNIDMNGRSLDIGKRNHVLNNGGIPGGYRNKAVFLPHDIFKSFGRLKKDGPYHLIIADPPPSQKGSFMIRKDYPRLLKRLPELLHRDGMIILTLNGPGWSWEDFEEMINENLPAFRLSERLQPPPDFAPAQDGRGLKIMILGKLSSGV